MRGGDAAIDSRRLQWALAPASMWARARLPATALNAALDGGPDGSTRLPASSSANCSLTKSIVSWSRGQASLIIRYRGIGDTLPSIRPRIVHQSGTTARQPNSLRRGRGDDRRSRVVDEQHPHPVQGRMVRSVPRSRAMTAGAVTLMRRASSRLLMLSSSRRCWMSAVFRVVSMKARGVA
jgi:hypothetical protein